MIRSDFRSEFGLGGIILTGLLALTGCVTVYSVNIGTKTSLEKQLIGELEPLSEEELLAASVRTSGSGAFVPMDQLQAKALSARRRQLFNRDDLDELKAWGCAGESLQGLIEARPCKKDDDAAIKERLARIVGEENADRTSVIDWAVTTDSTLTERDRPEVVQVYKKLLHERARPGDWVQSDEGGWKQR
jgi:hypothetical protein